MIFRWISMTFKYDPVGLALRISVSLLRLDLLDRSIVVYHNWSFGNLAGLGLFCCLHALPAVFLSLLGQIVERIVTDQAISLHSDTSVMMIIIRLSITGCVMLSQMDHFLLSRRVFLHGHKLRLLLDYLVGVLLRWCWNFSWTHLDYVVFSYMLEAIGHSCTFTSAYCVLALSSLPDLLSFRGDWQGLNLVHWFIVSI